MSLEILIGLLFICITVVHLYCLITVMNRQAAQIETFSNAALVLKGAETGGMAGGAALLQQAHKSKTKLGGISAKENRESEETKKEKPAKPGLVIRHGVGGTVTNGV